jgi:ABC-type nitrate/sulfonate/bicarbonate transport system substrate-binding protein
MKAIRPLAVLAVAALALSACGDDDSATATTPPPGAPTTEPSASTSGAPDAGVTAAGISPERCEANKAAGKITYLSGFDFAASPSIVDVVMADKQGYFDQLCLDVELRSGISHTNYPLIAANRAQFSSAGSFSETLIFAKGGAKFVTLLDYGKSNIAALLVRDDGKVTALGDLKGKTIGVKGALPPPVIAMLNKAGLKQGVDYKEVLLDGFDPKAHLAQPIDALPVFKSNEPGQLERAGIGYKMFDPSADGIPGTFGILYTNEQFLNQHPTAAQDFVRASLKGMEDAIADPDAAVDACLALIGAAGNQYFLSDEGERYRWQIERDLILESKGSLPMGVIDPALFQSEVDAYAAVGVFEAKPTDIGDAYSVAVAADVYAPDGTVIFPNG